MAKTIADKAGTPEDQYLIARAPLFHKIYATNVLVQSTDDDIRVDLFSERLQSEHGWHYIADGQAILSPQGAKLLLAGLQEAVKNFEGKHGQITTQRRPVQMRPEEARKQSDRKAP